MSSASDTTSGNAVVDQVREWLGKLSPEICPGGMLPLSQKISQMMALLSIVKELANRSHLREGEIGSVMTLI